MTKPKQCPACGAEGTVGSRARTGRHANYRSVDVELPAKLKLTECTACNELWLDDVESDAYSAAVDVAYHAELRRRACEALAQIEHVATQRHLERLLHLSHGYLSKVKNHAKAPSATLVGQLALLAADPSRRLAELERFWSGAAKKATSA